MNDKINYKKIMLEIYENGDGQINQEDADYLKFCYDLHFKNNNDLSSLQKMTILNISEKIK